MHQYLIRTAIASSWKQHIEYAEKRGGVNTSHVTLGIPEVSEDTDRAAGVQPIHQSLLNMTQQLLDTTNQTTGVRDEINDVSRTTVIRTKVKH